MLVLIGLIVGLVLLFFGGEWLVTGAARLARSLGISPLIIGLTVVAMGTSMPELLVSLSAILRDSSDISVGNVVGSNIANIGLILGISGLIYPISIHASVLRRELPIMLVVAVAAYITFLDGEVSRLDGALLVIGLIAFILFMIYASRTEQRQRALAESTALPEDDISLSEIQRGREILRLLLGIALLIIGAQLTVDNAVQFAESIGISERIIGITLIAVGTSLPELVTSATAAFRKESDIAIGNVVGSNIFNIVAILGITALVKPIGVTAHLINIDALVMLGFSFLLIPFVANRSLGRGEGAFFLLAYLSFLIYTFAAGA